MTTAPGGRAFRPPENILGTNRVPSRSPYLAPPSNGLLVQFKADALALADGAAVNTWTDSHAALTAGLLAGGSAPTFVKSSINGMPAVRFTDSVNNVLALSVADSAALLVSSFTIVLVASQAQMTIIRGFVSCLDATTSNGWHLSGFRNTRWTASIFAGGAGVGKTFTGNMSVKQNVGRVIVTHDVSVPDSNWYFSGNPFGTDAVQGVGYVAGIQFAIGAQSVVNGVASASRFPGVDIGEVLYYDHALSTADLSIVNDYLLGKWNV